MEQNGKELSESISGLSREVSSLNSFRRSFFRGIIFGVGSAIGAGIIAALLIGAFSQVLSSVGSVLLPK